MSIGTRTRTLAFQKKHKLYKVFMKKFIVNKKWLLKFSTKKGGYTAMQGESLGLTWPFKKGWKKRLIGKSISFQEADRFEKGRFIFKN